jgi:hypothetical protein
MMSDSDSRATVPSGSRAGVATELPVANTPGPGSGDIRSPRIRASTRSRWVGRLARSRLVKASTIAPTAAVMSSAEVSSNGKR